MRFLTAFGSTSSSRLGALRYATTIVFALVVLFALSHLDRAQTIPDFGFRGEGPCSLREVDVLPDGLHFRTPVWVAQSSHSEPAAVRLTTEGVPARASLGIALAGPVDQPVRIRWPASENAPAGERMVALPDSSWQIVTLPQLVGPDREIIFEISLREPREMVRLTKPVFLDVFHGPTARSLGRLATAVLTFALLASLATAAAIVFERRWPAPDRAQLILAAWFIVATAGYILFWAYFAHPSIGDGCAYLLLASALALLWLNADAVGALWRDARWNRPWLAILGVGIAYFGFLHSWSTDMNWQWLAANRFRPGLPGDNGLPQLFSEFLLQGRSPRNVDFEWMSSDRPPLQTGWYLLIGPLLRTTAYRYDTLCQAMGLWFQLLWIPALALFFERLGSTQRRGIGLALVVALTGFAIVHTQFVWPKLGGAAFILGAWVLWDGPGGGRLPIGVLCGLALALGFLSHGGVAFSILALAPFWLRPRAFRRGEWRHYILCGAIAALVYAPWSAYQRFYQPPGNHLLKWHLAGVIPIDDRGTWQTLRDSYAAKSWGELLAVRRQNLRFVFADGEWRQLWNFSRDSLLNRRSRDFFCLFRSIGWWNIGLVLLPFAWWKVGRVRLPMSPGFLGRTVGWIMLTLVIWIALMFDPHGTCIHQGSFVPPLVLIGLAVWSLDRLHPLALIFVGLAAATYFTCTYGFSPAINYRAELNVFAVLSVLAGFILALSALKADRRPDGIASISAE